MNSNCRLLSFLIVLFLPFMANAQQAGSRLQELTTKLDRYALSRQRIDIYLHLDKTLYVHNENIWFSAYVCSQDTVDPQHTLHTLLVESTTQKIVSEERFVIETGRGAGSIFLPDSLPVGEYNLLAYTNSYLNHPEQSVFRQTISIKAAQNPTFKTYLLPDITNNNDYVTFGYKVETSYGGLAVGGEFHYSLFAENIKIDSGSKTINAFGEVTFTLPCKQFLGKHLQLEATISKNKEVQIISVPVHLPLKMASIKLYPEGGNLVNNQETYIGIEIKNANGLPLSTTGQLLEDGRFIGSFYTNQLGAGIIACRPQQNKQYILRLQDSTLQPIYTFPPVAANGLSLHIPNAVIQDTAIMIEIGNAYADTFHLVAHNYRQAFFSGTFRSGRNRSALRLSTATFPEGIITVTLFNTAGIPQAERAILINKEPLLKVTMRTDSLIYRHRSKLALRIKITDSKGQPVSSFFSLACVLASRLDTTRAIDLVRYFQFDRYLPAPSTMPATSDLQYSENIQPILLTKFWTRYRWEEIDPARSPVQNTVPETEAGRVFYNNQRIKNPVQFFIMSAQTALYRTDSTGYFELPPHALRMEAGQKAMFLITGAKQKSRNYQVKLQNRYASVDTVLARSRYPMDGHLKAELSIQEQAYLKKSLNAVVVTAKKRSDYEVLPEYRSTLCNDWICMNNILNCHNHPIGSKPVKGNRYLYNGGMPVRYVGCVLDKDEEPGSFINLVNGVSYPKEFYVADYEQFNPASPEILSTLFWSHKILTDEKGEATVVFSSNDLSGVFSCVLQGFSSRGPISGKTYFKVIP